MSFRWYMELNRPEHKQGVVQVGDSIRRATQRGGDRITLPEHVLRLAQAEYERQFGHKQDYERMQERGGLSVMEVIGLLADAAERRGAKPTLPRAAGVAPKEPR